MPKDHSRAKNLLDKFDLNNYSECENLTLVGWYNQLAIRKQLWKIWTQDKSVNHAIHAISKYPLNFTAGKNINAGGLELYSQRPITDTTIFQVLDTADELVETNPDIRSEFLKLCNDSNLRPNDTLLDTSILETFFKNENSAIPFHKAPIFITVNLGASDSDLTKEFGNWLSRTRDRFNDLKVIDDFKKDVNKKELNSWVKKQVLAYIDLQIASDLTDIKIPQSLVGDYLFPEEKNTGIDLGERVRKITKPLASQLLSPRVLAALSAAAASNQ